MTLAVASVAGCNALFDIQPGQLTGADSGPGVDSGAEAGGDASTDSGGADVSSDAPACAGPTIYVSVTTGTDTNPGCSSNSPKKSIGAAIAAAAATSTVTSIQVCKGIYNENPLVLSTPTSLYGGYNCNTWKRTPTYGYPTFDGTEGTVIQNAAASVSSVTLELSGTAVTSAVVVDGFIVLGATSGVASATVSAVLVTNGAAPTLSNNQLTGGSLTVPDFIASAGVTLSSGGSPTITNNKINGGNGTVPPTSTESGHASVGIQADGTSATVQILDNQISGGSGATLNTLADGSVAMNLFGGSTGAGPIYTIRGNTIVAGTGTSTGGADTSGVFLLGTQSVDFESNSVDGGGGSTGTRCSDGVIVNINGASKFIGNRIYGGNCGASSNATAPQGLKVIGPLGTAPLIYNNMIHSGTATNTPLYGPSALLLTGGLKGADVRHNTLIGGSSNGATPQALWLDEPTSGVTVVNNILAGTATDAGVFVSRCGDAGPPSLAAFENNLIFATSLGLLKWDATCNGGAGYATVDATTAELLATQTGATVSGNVTLASSCTTDAGTDSGCVALAGCTSPQTCLTAFFGAWDVASNGYKNLFPATPFTGACPTVGLPPLGNGWTLVTTPAPPCKVTQSSVGDQTLPGLNVDLYGNCRSSTPTMGAEEASGVACH